MAVTNLIGIRPGAALIVTGQGILHGWFMSHAQTATPQTVTFYDNTAASGTILAIIRLNPAQMPHYVMFPRRMAIPFTTGLSADFTGVDLLVWTTALT